MKGFTCSNEEDGHFDQTSQAIGYQSWEEHYQQEGKVDGDCAWIRPEDGRKDACENSKAEEVSSDEDH